MNFRRYALVTTAFAALTTGAGTTAFAQTTSDTAAKPVTTLDEIVVTSIRRSLKASLDVKKKSDDVVEVVSAEAIGKFPDTNLAESLAHLPGVSVDHQFGEGDRVSIDGTDPALNRVFIDGHTVASADWGGDAQDTDGRNFNYSYISPDFVSQIVLYKNPEASIDEGSLGGTVEVLTRKPLDLPSNTMYVSGGYKYNDRASQGDISASAAYSWHNADDTLGAILAYTHNDEHLTRAGIEYYGYSQGTDFIVGGKAPTTASGILPLQNPGMTINGAAPTLASEQQLAAARYPLYTSYAYFQQTRDRDGLNGDISFKPFSNLQFDLSGMYIGGNYNNLSQAAYSYNVRTTRATNANISDGVVDSASYEAGPTGSSTWNGELDENYRHADINTYYVDLAYKWDIDGFKVTGDVGYTRAKGGTDPQYELNWRTLSGFTYGFNGPESSLNYTTPPTSSNFWLTEYNQAINAPTKSNYNPTVPGFNGGLPFKGFQVGGIDTQTYSDGEIYGKFDATHDINWGPFDEVLFGAKYSEHQNTDVEFGSETYGLVSGGQFSVGSLSSAVTPAGLYSGLDTSGNATQYSALTASQVEAEINSLPTKYNPLATSSYSDVHEDDAAVYAQANFKGDHYHGNLGLRVIDTKDVSTFFQSNNGGNTYFLTSVTQQYLKPLPSFNFAYNATDTVVLRFGAADVIARPRYSQLAGAYSISTLQAGDLSANDAGTAGGGNPHLKPYESDDFETTVEWYFKKNSVLEGEVFYRDIKSYVITQPTTQILTDPLTLEQGSYSVSTPGNAGDASVTGASVTGWYDLGWGFGIQTNGTYSDAKTSNGYNLPFLSKYVVNVIPYYEYGPVSARLSVNYRSDYFTQVGLLRSNDMTAAYTEIDSQFAYHVNKKMSIVFNAENLLDQTYYEYSNTKNAPLGIYKTGRTFGLTFQYRQ